MNAPTLLEEFVRDYVDVTGGVWDDIEPQVYDVMLPAGEADSPTREILRIAFDPEALPEHPGAQLASFGTPLIDALLSDAMRRGRYARLYLIGLNVNPHDLAGSFRRALTLPPESTLTLQRVRPLHFAQAVFWFQTTFLSDQKEQEVVPVALDLHYGRPMRHLDQLLDHTRLAEAPSLPLAEARRLSLAAAYPLAREAVMPTVAALANIRARDTAGLIDRQSKRMSRYYQDLRAELEDQVRRAKSRDEDLSRFAERRTTLEREEQLRLAELRQKSALQVRLRLLTVLLVQQPKLLAHVVATTKGHAPANLELVWDALTGTVEAAPCPNCNKPTFSWGWARPDRLVCTSCAASSAARSAR